MQAAYSDFDDVWTSSGRGWTLSNNYNINNNNNKRETRVEVCCSGNYIHKSIQLGFTYLFSAGLKVINHYEHPNDADEDD